MTTPRDITHDEEVPERSEEAREAFSHIVPHAALEVRRQRFSREFDAKANQDIFLRRIGTIVIKDHR